MALHRRAAIIKKPAALLVLAGCVGFLGAVAAQPDYYQRPGAKVSEVVEARGYLAKEYFFMTDDGYVLGMTRALNPLIDAKARRRLNRRPLLFIHGTLVDGNSFVANSFDIEGPKDFSHMDPDQLSELELVETFGGEPSAKSLAFFALDFGHEVWFLHRRGASLSQRRIPLPPRHAKPPTVMEKLRRARRAFNRRRRAKAKRKAGTRRLWRRHVSFEEAAGEHIDGEPPDERQSGQAATDFSGRNAHELTDKQLGKLGRKRPRTRLDGVVRTVPMALLDNGHFAADVHVTRDARLWNHSFDEQAAYDLPRAVDFVLKRTGHERLAIVGDSAGGALIIMSLILEPTLNQKLSKAVAWVPSLNIGHAMDPKPVSKIQFLFDYIGPFPPTFLSVPLQALMESACSVELVQVTVCTKIVDAQLGDSAEMSPIRGEFQSHYLTPVSAHEYLQLTQFVTYNQTRMFDFGAAEANMRAYGQRRPPYYNGSLVSFEYLSIYVAAADNLVTMEDIGSFTRDLTVPFRLRVLDQPGTNHAAVLYHNNVSTIIIIPTYKDIVSHGYRG